jgi:DNA/RNA endonuclease YhcR with UshA esterase domain
MEETMTAKLTMLMASVGVVLAAAPLVAHHSFAAEYDASKPVTLKGAVTRLEWTNPHARFYIDVKDETGAVANWNLELASPNVLTRNGWTRNTLKIGEQVTVEGTMAKDGSKMANARVVMLSDGRRVFAGSSQDNPAQQ